MLTLTLMFTPAAARVLPRRMRNGLTAHGAYLTCSKSLREPASLYDVLGSLGIPPCEVGRVTVGERGGDFFPDALVEAGETYGIEVPSHRSLPDPRFLCDLHLGKLVLLLRVLGFDTLWEASGDEEVMAERAMDEGRLVLSRNRALLKRRALRHALLVLSDHPDRQAAEVLRRFDLAGQVRLFGRCSRCNGTLAPVPKAVVADRIPPKTAKWLDTYYLCRDCDQLFWEGTHVIALRDRAAAILGSCETEDR